MALAGKVVGMFVDFAYEDLEVHYPLIRLKEEGATVWLISIKPAGALTYTGKHGYPCKSTHCIDDVTSSQLDALILPGGFAPDYMRRSAAMLKVVSEMVAAAKPVAAICHGPWMLCSARGADGKPVCSGVTCTGFVAIKDDVVNAGGVWCDEPVVNDRNIITSRTPNDLTPFCQAIIAAMKGLK